MAFLKRSIPPAATLGLCQQVPSHVTKPLPIVSCLQVRLLWQGTEATSNWGGRLDARPSS